MMSLFGTFWLGLSLAYSVSAETLFEGYSVIKAGGSAIGYVVQRYEFDSGKKQFKSIYFLKTNDQGGNITESLTALANDKFQPISYQYTTKAGAEVKIIDAKFAKGMMTGTVSDGKSTQTLNRKMDKGVFLSTFLGYLMLQNGLKVNKKFNYSAIAEEDAKPYSGIAHIKSEEELEGEKVYKIENSFKDAKFTSFVTPKGEVVGTASTEKGIYTELKASPAEATQGFVLPNETLKLLFGGVPTGTSNVWAQKKSSALTPAATPPTSPSAPAKPPPAKSN